MMDKLFQVSGRVLLSHLFLLSGISKIGAYAGTQQYMESMGIPGELLAVVIGLEIVGGLAIMLGWQVKMTALALAGFSIVSAIIFHADFANQMQLIMFMKNFTIAGGLLLLASYGAGAYSIDAYRSKQRGEKDSANMSSSVLTQ